MQGRDWIDNMKVYTARRPDLSLLFMLGPALSVRCVSRVPLRLDQLSHALVELGVGEAGGRAPVVVLVVQVGAEADERGRDVSVLGCKGHVQRRRAVAVARGGVGAGLEQQCDHRRVALVARPVQGDVPLVVDSVGRGAR
eukprot:1545866-Pleurochrysis_carterae.AAC.6